MNVSGLDSKNDWRFGRGRALYLKGSQAIAQKVTTRIRSFKNDWFLDVEAGIDWLNLLSERGTNDKILREVERVITSTEGVLTLDSIDLKVNTVDRVALIYATYTDVYNSKLELNEEINP